MINQLERNTRLRFRASDQTSKMYAACSTESDLWLGSADMIFQFLLIVHARFSHEPNQIVTTNYNKQSNPTMSRYVWKFLFRGLR